MSKKYNAEFDEYAETYDEGLKKLLGVLGGNTEKFAEYKIQLLKSLLQFQDKKIKFLDFGCGTGRSLAFIKEYFPNNDVELFGCDVSSESLRVAKRIVPSASFFKNTPLEAITAFGEKYDVVMLACVLHHISPSEREQWVKAIIENLNPGGKIVVFEHNLINPFTKRIVNDSKLDNANWMLKMSELVRLLLCNNTTKLFWKGYTCFSPFRPTGTTSLEKCLKWLPLGAQQCVIVEKI